VVEAGSIVFMHYDVVHRASKNFSADKQRVMFKFQFMRFSAPHNDKSNLIHNNDSERTNSYLPVSTCDIALDNKFIGASSNFLQRFCEYKFMSDAIYGSLFDGSAFSDELNDDNENSELCEKLTSELELVRLTACYRLVSRRHLCPVLDLLLRPGMIAQFYIYFSVDLLVLFLSFCSILIFAYIFRKGI
jgi:hypothetical protein